MNVLSAACFALLAWSSVVAAQDEKAATKDPFASVPTPEYPTLAKSYSGYWQETLPQYNYYRATNKNSLVIASQQGANAQGTYTSYPSSNSTNKCWRFVDAPMELRWRNATTLTLTATHPDKDCPKRTFNLTLEPGGQLTWKSRDGNASSYYDPE